VVLFLFDNVIYVVLLLWLCILIVCLCRTTLAEVFPCFFFSCKANARVKPAKMGQARTLPNFCVVLCKFVLFYVLFVLCRSLYCLCICALYYCHRVATHLQLNIYHMISNQKTVNRPFSYLCMTSSQDCQILHVQIWEDSFALSHVCHFDSWQMLSVS
jgi:hypothetical protein